MKATNFKVKATHCENCENTPRTILALLPGVVYVVPSVERNDVNGSDDDAKIAEAELRQKLLEVGYEPIS